MGMRQDQMDAVRQWLETVVDTGDYPGFDPDTRVLDEPFRGPRPDTNYLTLQMLVYNRMRSSTGDPGWMHDKPNATVESVVRVQAFGEEAFEWLNQALALIFHVDVDAQLVSDVNKGFQIEPLGDGGISDISGLLEKDYEIRGVVDILVSCRRVIDRVTSEVTTVSIPDYDVVDSGGALESDITVDLS